MDWWVERCEGLDLVYAWPAYLLFVFVSLDLRYQEHKAVVRVGRNYQQNPCGGGDE